MVYNIIAIVFLSSVFQFFMSFILDARHPAFATDPYIRLQTGTKKERKRNMIIFVKYYILPYLIAAFVILCV